MHTQMQSLGKQWKTRERFTVHAACKVEHRSICRSVELTADVLFSYFIECMTRMKDETKLLIVQEYDII